MKKILCMGSIAVDMIMRVPRFPSPGETVKTDNFATNPGAKASNQAMTVARLGGQAAFFTKLGGDANSRELTRQFVDMNIDMGAMLYDPDLMAGVAFVQVDVSTSQNECTFFPGACLYLTPEEVENGRRAIEGCDILMITTELAPETVFKAIAIAHDLGKIVLLDPAPAPRGGIPDEIAAMVHIIKPNETEAELLTGLPVNSGEQAALALEKLRRQGFINPIITLGERGCVAWIDNGARFYENVPVDCVDTTAAGDVFIGSLAYALSLDKPLAEAVVFAQTASAVCVSRAGAQVSIPTLNEVMALYRKQPEICGDNAAWRAPWQM
jgi:ribokinase